ncbi:MAG: SelB C-terminal domain-containing protein, partial [Acidimicrobiia bacterium]
LGPRLLAGRPWLKPAELVRLAGVDAAGAEGIARELVSAGEAVGLAGWLVSAGALEETRRRAAEAVADHHRRHPLEPGLEITLLAPGLRLDPAQVKAALEGVAGLVVEQGRVRSATHQARVSEEPEALRVLEALGKDPFAPPGPSELGARPEIVRGLVREGLLVDVEGLVFTAEAVEQAREIVRRGLAEHGSLTVAQARDLLGSSRKYVLALLARMDSEGVTRRRGDERFPGPKAEGASRSG